jgi:hypothetical protein
MTVEELTTAMYERAREIGLQNNYGPDPVAFQMEAIVDDINYSNATDDGVRAQWLLDRATLKFAT